MYGPFVMAAQNEDGNFLDLYLQNDLNKCVENLGFDSRALPIIKTNNYTFYAMPSTELAYKPYHAYSKITFLDNQDENSIDFFYSSLSPFSPQPEPQPIPEPTYVDSSSQTGDVLPLFSLLALALCMGLVVLSQKARFKIPYKIIS